VEFIYILYFWSIDSNQQISGYQSNTKSHQNTNLWYEKLRKLSCSVIRNQNINGKIGSVGHIVQINESKFSKRKHEVGRMVRCPWIVAGIDYTTREVFFVETFFRNSDSLLNIIINHVAEGSVIYTDCWAGYSNLASIGFGHFTVNIPIILSILILVLTPN
jgi:hypothetical protein